MTLLLPHRTCHQKVGYDSRREARDACKSMERRRGGHPRPYVCPACNQWHVSSMTRTDLKRVLSGRDVVNLSKERLPTSRRQILELIRQQESDRQLAYREWD